jgi:YHS domain-containing protein
MPKVLFTVQYDVLSDKRSDYVTAIKELKSLVHAEGLETYSVYELKGKTNTFEEVYIFSSQEAYENFDDAEDERINVLISKIESLKSHNSTKYSTLVEL